MKHFSWKLVYQGEILALSFADWSPLSMSTWLTHTWQYASENGWTITTGIPSLHLKCENDRFLMDIFWKHGYCGSQLAALNHCRLWLQIVTLADIVDGHGTHMLLTILARVKQHSSPSPYRWPKQGPPNSMQWSLWKKH